MRLTILAVYSSIFACFLAYSRVINLVTSLAKFGYNSFASYVVFKFGQFVHLTPHIHWKWASLHSNAAVSVRSVSEVLGISTKVALKCMKQSISIYVLSQGTLAKKTRGKVKKLPCPKCGKW